MRQQSSVAVVDLLQEYEIVTWWGTPVEVSGATARLARTGDLDAVKYAAGLIHLQELHQDWYGIEPTIVLRITASSFLQQYILKAADALQLAAAWVWANGTPAGKAFITGDRQLAEAARGAGFLVLET